MRIAVLVLNGAFDSGLSTVLDTFDVANTLAPSAGLRGRPFDVTVTGVRRAVRTAQGLTVPVSPAARVPRPDLVIVPAIGAKTPATLGAALADPEIRAAAATLGGWAKTRATLAAACTGTFVLADAGLLDGHPATTSWWLGPFFRERYPAVQLDETRMLVGSVRRMTAGAAIAHLDLALAIVRGCSPALAGLAARYLVTDARPSQAAFIIPSHLAHADPLITRFEQWARARVDQRFSLARAAAGAGTSERTLSRRVQAVLGKSPLAYVQDLRLEHALHALSTTPASVEDVAGQVGYADGATLRALIRRRTGRGLREIRRRA